MSPRRPSPWASSTSSGVPSARIPASSWKAGFEPSPTTRASISSRSFIILRDASSASRSRRKSTRRSSAIAGSKVRLATLFPLKPCKASSLAPPDLLVLLARPVLLAPPDRQVRQRYGRPRRRRRRPSPPRKWPSPYLLREPRRRPQLAQTRLPRRGAPRERRQRMLKSAGLPRRQSHGRSRRRKSNSPLEVIRPTPRPRPSRIDGHMRQRVRCSETIFGPSLSYRHDRCGFRT